MTKSTRALLALALTILALATLLLYHSSAVFLQLFIALALAYILNPAVNALERKGIHRIAGIATVFAATVVIITGFSIFLATSVHRELSSMQLNLPAYTERLYQILPSQLKAFLGIESSEKLSLRVNDLMQQARSLGPDLLKPLLAVLRSAFSSTVGFILTLLGYCIIPVYLFYLLADMPRLKTQLESYVPERHRPALIEKLSEIDLILSGFIRGQLSICAILAVLYSIGLYFIGIDLAVAIGTLAGITFIIPYLGTILGVVLSVVMALLKFHDLLHPLLCLGWIVLVQGLEGMVLTPRIVGSTVGLHPLITILALLVGGDLFGITGMLVAVPVTAVLQVFLRSLAFFYRQSEFYRGAQ